jgi:O-antigen/teichoic acid export membrane protein
MSLKKQAVGGVKWTAIAAIFSAVLQLVQIAVLARYLDKKDFGLMALALFVIEISQIFIDMGISNAIIHKQHVNKFQLSTLYWLNIFIGIAIYLLILLCAPFVAAFYKTPELIPVLHAIAITFLIIPFGQLYETLLRRDLKFQALSTRDIIGKVIGFIVAVTLAVKHFGVFALVYANIITALVSTILLITNGLKIFKPKFIFSRRSLNQKGFFSFGLFQIGEQIVNYFNSQFDTLLIGKLLGMEALGVYNLAKTLASRPYKIINPIITKVAFPVFAKLQNDIDKLKQSYLKVIQFLAITNAPIYALLIILAKPITIVFFGKHWIDAAPILQLLSISALSNSINNPVGSLQLARGRADLGFYWNLGLFITMPLAMYLGSHWGIMGIVWSLVISKIILQIPTWYYFIKPLCNVGFTEYFQSFGRPIILSFIAGIISFLLVNFFNGNILQISIGLSVFVPCYLILFYWQYKELVIDLVNNLKGRLKLK